MTTFSGVVEECWSQSGFLVIARRTGEGVVNNVKTNRHKIWRTAARSIPRDLLVLCLLHSGPPFLLRIGEAARGVEALRMEHQHLHLLFLEHETWRYVQALQTGRLAPRQAPSGCERSRLLLVGLLCSRVSHLVWPRRRIYPPPQTVEPLVTNSRGTKNLLNHTGNKLKSMKDKWSFLLQEDEWTISFYKIVSLW